MWKMVLLAYNEAVDSEVMEALEKSGLKNYTKTRGVFGCGENSGAHLGNDIWPGRNNLLYVAAEEKQAQQLIAAVKELRRALGKEGLKAFILPVEEVT